VFQVGAGDWVIVVGDVAGKGVEAAVVTALARYTLRGAAVRSPSPADSLVALNEVLLGDDSERFCTAVVMRLRQSVEGWEAVIASGGHPLPLLHRVGEEPLPVGREGSLLGAFSAADFFDVRLDLQARDRLLVYTDGVTEGRRQADFYEEARLRRFVARHPGASAQALVAAVLADVLHFQADNARDDIAIVAVWVP
jgi:sigma-B regulation protein RsbU (phosphoserine phosphatase)